MCASVAYTFLAGLATFVVVTALAFATLDWWQALLVSLATFAALVLIGRYLVYRTVRRVKGLVQVALDLRGKILKGSSVDVHSVRAPGGGLQLIDPQGVSGGAGGGRTYTVEFTLFPPDPAAEWYPAELRFAPEGSPAPALFGAAGGNDIQPEAVQFVDGEGDTPAAGAVTGARRLRVTLDARPGVKQLVVRYGLAEFGRIDLSKLTPGGVRNS